MDSRKVNVIFNKLKKGKLKSVTVLREVDLIGDCYYEEHLFYNAIEETFYRQIIDWSIFSKKGIRKGIQFEKLNDLEAKEDIVTSLEFEADIDDK